MPVRALLLDLDGTLVDTNAAHAAAFADALAAHGYDVPYDDVLRGIGMGGDKLVPALVGADGEASDGAAIRRRKDERFAEIARAEAFPLIDGATALIAAARRRGLRLALCTAAKEEALGLILESAGVDVRPDLDVVTTATDVDESKPDPDVLHAAMEKLGLPPEACVLVGDTVYDGETAARAGVAFLGVATGVWTADELLAAGASAVYADAAALAADLDGALAAVEGAAVEGAAVRA